MVPPWIFRAGPRWVGVLLTVGRLDPAGLSEVRFTVWISDRGDVIAPVYGMNQSLGEDVTGWVYGSDRWFGVVVAPRVYGSDRWFGEDLAPSVYGVNR
jgi:hypothetical protein